MAAGVLSSPGSEYGPCVAECEHRDCGQTRAMAAALCSRCGEPIGYGVRFYDVTPRTPVGAFRAPSPPSSAPRLPGRVPSELTYAHAACEEKAIDEEEAAVKKEVHRSVELGSESA